MAAPCSAEVTGTGCKAQSLRFLCCRFSRGGSTRKSCPGSHPAMCSRHPWVPTSLPPSHKALGGGGCLLWWGAVHAALRRGSDYGFRTLRCMPHFRNCACCFRCETERASHLCQDAYLRAAAYSPVTVHTARRAGQAACPQKPESPGPLLPLCSGVE